MAFEYAIIVKNKTRLESLVERFNTRAQAKFYIERLGGDFEERGAVAALDVLAAGGFGHHEDAAALEVRTHDADVLDRVHRMNLL